MLLVETILQVQIYEGLCFDQLKFTPRCDFLDPLLSAVGRKILYKPPPRVSEGDAKILYRANLKRSTRHYDRLVPSTSSNRRDLFTFFF